MSIGTRRALLDRAVRSALLGLCTAGAGQAFASLEVTTTTFFAGTPYPLGTPTIMTADPNSTSQLPFVAENVNKGATGGVLAQTFKPTSDFKLGQISIYSTGASGTTGSSEFFTLHIFDVTNPASLPGSYHPGASGTNPAEAPGGDLFGGGTGIPFQTNPGADRYVNFTFAGPDQVQLQANHLYAFEIWAPTNSTSSFFWPRVSGGAPSGGNPYADGNGFQASTSDAGTLRTQIAGNNRDLYAGIYSTAALPALPLRVDLSGGNSGELRPAQANWRNWTNLPQSGNSNNGNVAENGYPTQSISRDFATSGVSSGTIKATLTAVHVQSGTFVNDGPSLNSRDLSISGREFDNSGNFTPTKDYVYRDFIEADIGTNTINNGANHRLETKLEGLDPKTTYKVTVYAYDNANQKGINVFTDVTANNSVELPTGFSSNGVFTPGEGAAGTQWAPSGQYIDGSAAVTFPTADNFRALSLYLTSDASGKIILDQTTVTGVADVSQIIPVLNGFEVEPGSQSWTGASNTDWNTAGNWSGAVPNGKGQGAVISGSGGAINVSSQVKVGMLKFTGGAYTIGGSTITLDDNSVNSSVSNAVTGRAEVLLAAGAGNQTITAPVSLLKDTTFTVTNGSQTLTLTNLKSSTAWVRKSGAGNLVVNSVRATGLAATDAGTISVAAGRSSAATSKVNALSIAAGSSVNLNDQDLIVDYGVTSPLTTVKSLITTGYNSGAWTGTGLTSASAAAASGSGHRTALGYAEASTLGVGSFSGQTVDSTSVLVRYTYAGDANLDGKVNTVDFNQLAGGFGTGNSWTQGDFDYNGTVNSIDFTLLASNYGLNLPIAGSPSLGSVVPEPASLGLISIAGLLLRRKRA